MGDVTLTQEQFGQYIADFIQIGRMQMAKAYEPLGDMVRAAELKSWCMATSTDYKAVEALIKGGVIARHRTGEAKNSPIVYSKQEVIQAVVTAKISSDMTFGWRRH